MIFKKFLLKKNKMQNRIVVSPMCQYSANNGAPSNWHYKHLGSLICSGASMLVIESTAVNKIGRITDKDLCLYNSHHFKKLKKLIKYLKSLNNIPIIIQLSHAGKKGSSYVPWIKSNTALKKRGWKTISASKIKKDKFWPYPREASEVDINKIIDDFKKSATLAKKAGVDGIEIHMAHGYLIHQFLSPISNIRKDNYGGNFKKRNSLALKIVEKIKKITKKDLILGARVTATDHLKNGINLDQSIKFIKQLKNKGLDYVCISSGGIETITGLNPKKKAMRGLIASKIKKKIKNILIGTTGNLYDLDQLNKILKKKYFDLAFIGRPFLKNPNWLFNYAAKNNKRDIISKPYNRSF
jgi:2,4-dienoyl-CoA reductase-like NADH-dependent reductase (Old Yellow Enzyme family)